MILIIVCHYHKSLSEWLMQKIQINSTTSFNVCHQHKNSIRQSSQNIQIIWKIPIIPQKSSQKIQISGKIPIIVHHYCRNPIRKPSRKFQISRKIHIIVYLSLCATIIMGSWCNRDLSGFQSTENVGLSGLKS